MKEKQPVLNFESQEQLDKYLAWWQEKLGLSDWIIKASVISIKDFELDDSCGENLMVFENKSAVIHIADYKEMQGEDDLVVKYCQEKVLVHELLHCLYDFMKPPENSFEGKYLDVLEHQKLETMAKGLIMVKYDLPFSWFKNDKNTNS